MTVSLHAGFDFTKLGTFSITVTDVSGGGAQALSFTTGRYCHVNIASVVSTHTLFATTLKTTLDALPGAGVYTVTFNSATCRYTIASTTSFSLTGTTGGTTLAAKVLGLTADTGSAVSHASSRNVWYSLPCSSGCNGFTNDTNVTEPDGIVEDAEADDGTSFATARATAPKYRDFELQFNSKIATHKASETATAPFSFERFCEHTRGQEPIAIYDSAVTAGVVGYQRARGASFRPRRMISNNDLYWSWPISIRQRGTI